MKNFDQWLENDNYKEEPVDVSKVDIAAAYPKMLEDFVHLNSRSSPTRTSGSASTQPRAERRRACTSRSGI